MRKDEQGTILIEFVGSFLLFLLLILSILSLVNIGTMQARMHYALTQTANTLSMYGYTLHVMGLDEKLINIAKGSAAVTGEANASIGEINEVLANIKTGEVMTVIRAEVLIVFGYIAAYIDVKTRKVPNKLVLTMLGVWAVIMAAYVIIDMDAAADLLIQSLVSGAAGGGFFLLMYLASRRGVGGGDVKLVAVMGLFMTMAKLMPMLFFTALLSALVSAALLVSKRATMKTAIPLVPFLYAGNLITIFI